MKKLKKLFVLCIAFCMMLTPVISHADVPYKTYTQNGYGEMVENQTAYISSQTVTVFGDYRLGNPQDLKITDNDMMYICDAGLLTNGITPKIIQYDIKNEEVVKIFDEGLVNPTGIFVTDDGYIYVADQDFYSDKEQSVLDADNAKSDHGAVVVFDPNGNIVRKYGHPDSPLYGASVQFKPQKVAVSGATMYISCAGNTNGLAQISETEGGTFLGYFGTNQTSVTLYQMFLNMILTDEQKAQRIGNTPQSISNVAIDAKGLIYTLSTSDTQTPVKKLNIAGTNLIQMDIPVVNPGSVCVGQYENIYVASLNYIYEYSKEGTLLFMYGGADNDKYRKGLFRNISAIDVDSTDRIVVLDSVAKEVQIFIPTEFTQLVHESLALYQRGEYSASKEPLEQIILMNGLFDYANLAMGQALEQEGDYENAMRYYRLAKERDGYSDAFWEVRNEWLNDNLVTAIVVIVLLIVIKKVIDVLDKKKGILAPVRAATGKVTGKLLWKRCFHGLRYMRHPIDGAYEVKRKGMCSYIAISILLVVILLINIISKYFAGFLVKTVKDGYYEIPTDVAIVVVGFLFAAGCTYLVACIQDGEGRFREILAGYLYSFTPYIVLQPIIFLVGQVVTYNEYFVIEFANVIMMTWIVILLFLTVMEINNYSFKETVKVICLTFFAAFIFAVAIFIMYVLTSQVINFVRSVYGEVVFRIGSK